MQSKPLVVVPKSPQVAQMIEAAPLSVEPRAQRVGIVVIAPGTLRPADLMVACHFWPKELRGGVRGRRAGAAGVPAAHARGRHHGGVLS